MYTLEQYNNMNILLTNSLVIKFLDAGIQINNGLKELYGLEPPIDYNDWKYFMNIAGEKHRTNKPVMIKLVEDDTIVELTKEVLNTYELTKKELLKYDKYYIAVKEEYPNEILYINGCLNPVDKDKAISAKDGDILSYGSKYVEPNEYDLIRELTKYIKNFISRWYISKYNETDSLYLTSFLGMLYSSLPNKINNIRLNNINTNKVHSFHLESFFRSNYDIWDEVKIFNNKTILWLYRNLKYITTNIGSNNTLNTVISNLFEANGIGVGQYILPTPKIIENLNNDLDTPTYTRSENVFLSKKLNNSYEIDRDSTIPIKTMVDIELKLDDTGELLNEQINYISNDVTDKLKNSLTITQNTKILDINKVKLFRMFNVDIINFLLSNWGYLASTNRYRGVVSYIDPNNNKTYNITPYEGYLITLKLMLSAIGSNDTLLSKNIMTKVISLDKTNVHKAHDNSLNPVLKNIVDEIDDELPSTYPNILSSDIFNTYISKTIDTLTKLWSYCVNVDNNVDSSTIKLISDAILVTETNSLTLNNELATIDDILGSKDIIFEIGNNYKHNLAIKELFMLFTGYNIFIDDDISDVINSYANILDKLTSYTVQVTKTTFDSKIIQVPYTSTSVLSACKGYINITDAEITSALENNHFKVSSEGNNFREKINMLSEENTPYGGVCNVKDFGIAKIIYQESELTANITKPNTYVELLTDCLPMTTDIINSKPNIKVSITNN